MAERTNDGGPAFPTLEHLEDQQCTMGQNGHYLAPSCNGMSLRDWFAGQALAGMLSDTGYHENKSWKETAELAFKQADAMLAERDKPKSPEP